MTNDEIKFLISDLKNPNDPWKKDLQVIRKALIALLEALIIPAAAEVEEPKKSIKRKVNSL